MDRVNAISICGRNNLGSICRLTLG